MCAAAFLVKIPHMCSKIPIFPYILSLKKSSSSYLNICYIKEF